MLEIKLSNRFKKDLRLAVKRGFNTDDLYKVVNIIASGQQLDRKYGDHLLIGNYSGFRECHVNPDYLLVYSIRNETVELYLFRLGTHSDLF